MYGWMKCSGFCCHFCAPSDVQTCMHVCIYVQCVYVYIYVYIYVIAITCLRVLDQIYSHQVRWPYVCIICTCVCICMYVHN